MNKTWVEWCQYCLVASNLLVIDKFCNINWYWTELNQHWNYSNWITTLSPCVEMFTAKLTLFQSDELHTVIDPNWLVLNNDKFYCFKAALQQNLHCLYRWFLIIDSVILLFIFVKLLWNNLYCMKCCINRCDFTRMNDLHIHCSPFLITDDEHLVAGSASSQAPGA